MNDGKIVIFVRVIAIFVEKQRLQKHGFHALNTIFISHSKSNNIEIEL